LPLAFVSAKIIFELAASMTDAPYLKPFQNTQWKIKEEWLLLILKHIDKEFKLKLMKTSRLFAEKMQKLM